MTDDTQNNVVICTLQHHGAAASTCPNVIAWIPTAASSSSSPSSSTNCSNDDSSSSTLVYASHGIVNLSQQVHLELASDHGGGGGGEKSQQETTVWNVTHTLRTGTVGGTTDTAADCKRTITALAYITPRNKATTTTITALATGFSDGTITVWMKCFDNNHNECCWKEFIVQHPPSLAKNKTAARSITALDALWLSENRHIAIVTGSSAGARLYILAYDQQHQQQQEEEQQEQQDLTVLPRLLDQPLLEKTNCISTVRLILNEHLGFVVLLGTAAPRHNRIHVYHAENGLETLWNNDNDTTSSTTTTTMTTKILHHAGSLTGHEDWISCMAWNNNTVASSSSAAAAGNSPSSLLLATGSQDCRIRLWKFTTTVQDDADCNNIEKAAELNENNDDDDDNSDIQSDGGADDDEEDEEGESRLEIHHHHIASSKTITRVTLEALLMGHEERVTAVCWHPRPNQVQVQHDGDNDNNDHNYLLISSSMDRSIFLWAPSRQDGIWTPITRVGSAGGILGGSVGSTLLGYLNVAIEPMHGRCLIGHAYGGSLHVWRTTSCHDDGEDDSVVVVDTSNENQIETITTASAADNDTTAASLSMVQWRAQPCITGHFDGVTDLCWETMAGDYLLTTSLDQTCRLWAPVSRAKSTIVGVVDDDSINKNHHHPVWVELARPQVHGYNLSAVASLSTRAHPHLLVTGADEKELRAFDAPLSTIRTLQGISGVGISNMDNADDPIHRVDRAYIPSLGLSNRATATDAAAEEDVPEDELYQHGKDSSSTNRVRLPLERDLGAVSLWPEIRKLYGHNTELYCLASTLAARTTSSDNDNAPVLVASSCKARNVDDAAIRLWNVEQGTCYQVLKGGHKSTVATLAFSPDGQFLASSGKDRRLCLWKKKKSSSNNDTNTATASSSDDGQFDLAWAKDVAHKRIVWSVHFLPWKTTTTTNDGPGGQHILASGSRDGCIKLWRTHENNSSTNNSSSVVLEELTSFAPAFCVKGKPDAVTSLAFGPKPCSRSLSSAEGNGTMAMLAVGLESGRLELWKAFIPSTTISSETTTPNTVAAAATLALSLPPWQCHLATITKLAWKPQSNAAKNDDNDDSSMSILASSSMDHGVRVYQIQY